MRKAQNIETEIQVAPESAFGHRLLQIAVGGCQDTNVDGNAARASHRTNFLFLNGPQKFGLKVDRKFADFVEKYGSAFGDGQQSVFGLIGTGERSTDIAEQLAFNQRGDKRAAVDGNERLVAKRFRSNGWNAPPFLFPCRFHRESARDVSCWRLWR